MGQECKYKARLQRTEIFTHLILVHVLRGENAGLCLHDVLDDDPVLLLDLLRHRRHVLLKEVQLLLLPGDVTLQTNNLLDENLAVRHYELICLENLIMDLRIFE